MGCVPLNQTFIDTEFNSVVRTIKIPFVHKAIAFQDWKNVKHSYPLGQIPVLEIEEEGKEKQVIAQSTAILRYLGKLGGLYPSDPVEALKVDSMIDTANEAARSVEMTVLGAVATLVSDHDWSKEQVLEIRHRIASNEKYGLPFYLSYFEKVLGENRSGWLVGNTVTVADLMLHRVETWVRGGMLDGIPSSILDQYPKIKEHNTKIISLPDVIEWRKNYPTPYTDFEFSANECVVE